MLERSELMLVFSVGDAARELRGRFRVAQQVSPRVVLVEAVDDLSKQELQTMIGVDAVLGAGESLPSRVRQTLTPTEEVFVDAFEQRGRGKERPGEGLSWDAEGFLPPDKPKKD